MSKNQRFWWLVQIFLGTILFLGFSSALAKEQVLTLRWGQASYGLHVEYDKANNETAVFSKARDLNGHRPEKALIKFPGFVEFKMAKNFFGPGRDGMVAIHRRGSGGYMKYEVYRISSWTSGLQKIPGPSREIPAGEIVVGEGDLSNNCFFVFTGVRYYVAYYEEGYVVELFLISTKVEKGIPVIIFSLNEDGEIETLPSDLPAKGIKVHKDQKLYLLRSDLREPLEFIHCDIPMQLSLEAPCIRTFPVTGKGSIALEIGRKLIKVPLTVIK